MADTKWKSRDRWEMRVAGLAMDAGSNVPVVVLRDLEDRHQLPIWIGQVEAMAIATEIEGVRHSRPMTHDLLRDVIARLGWDVTRIDIFDLRDNTFHARIVLTRAGEERVMDSRPSDAIALALRTKARIFAADHVLEQARMDVPVDGADDPVDRDANGADPDDLTPQGPRHLMGPIPDSDEEWEELLETMDPSDFGEYKQ